MARIIVAFLCCVLVITICGWCDESDCSEASKRWRDELIIKRESQLHAAEIKLAKIAAVMTEKEQCK